MSDDGSVLSQAEIDALFRQATGVSIAPPAVAAPVATSTPGPPTKHASSPPLRTQSSAPHQGHPALASERSAAVQNKQELSEIQARLSEYNSQMELLAQRIAKLEGGFLEINQAGNDCVSTDSGTLLRKLAELNDGLRKVSRQTAGMQKGLDGTPAYNLANDFTCSQCGSHGHLAVPVNCTNCGKEGWWGWFPKDER